MAATETITLRGWLAIHCALCGRTCWHKAVAPSLPRGTTNGSEWWYFFRVTCPKGHSHDNCAERERMLKSGRSRPTTNPYLWYGK